MKCIPVVFIWMEAGSTSIIEETILREPSVKPLFLFLLAILTISCQPKQACHKDKNPTLLSTSMAAMIQELPPFNPTPGYFASCKELNDYTAQINQRILARNNTRKADTCAMPLPAMANVAAPTTGAAQPTQVQEANIDEADTAKVHKDYIFYARPGSIEVLRRSDLQWQRSIRLASASRPELYVYLDWLIVVEKSEWAPAWLPPTTTLTRIAIAESFAVSKIITLKGYLVGSRLGADGNLILISYSPFSAIQFNSESLCTQVPKPFVADAASGMTHLYSLALSPLGVTDQQQQHLLGNFSEIYVNKKIYLSQQGSFFVLNGKGRRSHKSLLTTQFDFVDGKLTMTAVGAFAGNTVGPWSFKEKDDHFLVATSQDMSSLEIARAEDGVLKIVGAVTGLAPGEQLKSVRYLGNYAYLVTYRQVDPLFVIDIQNLEAPQLLGELKVPGFSSYLHPIAGQRLLGVGYDDLQAKLQLSLFDISDPLTPTLLEQKTFEALSSSPAQHDHHAFYYDATTERIALPVQWRNAPQAAFFYSVTANALEFTTQISHLSSVMHYCKSIGFSASNTSGRIERILALDNRLITISDFGIQEHDQTNPGILLNQAVFAEPAQYCKGPMAL